MVMKKKTLKKTSKSHLNELQNPPVTYKSNSEGTNKAVKSPWISIIGSELRKAVKKKDI